MSERRHTPNVDTRLHRVDTSNLPDARAVHVVEGSLEDGEHPESVPRPHALAATINWLLVVLFAVAAGIASVPELRAFLALLAP